MMNSFLVKYIQMKYLGYTYTKKIIVYHNKLVQTALWWDLPGFWIKTNIGWLLHNDLLVMRLWPCHVASLSLGVTSQHEEMALLHRVVPGNILQLASVWQVLWFIHLKCCCVYCLPLLLLSLKYLLTPHMFTITTPCNMESACSSSTTFPPTAENVLS